MLKDYELKDGRDDIRSTVFVVGNVLNGADSVDRLMMATYLSQFENPRGELAKKPIFKPDFRIGCVPYSRELGEVINDIIGGGFLVQFPYGSRKGIGTVVAPTSMDRIWLETNLGTLEENIRLYDLYKRNLANLEKYPNPDMRKILTKLIVKDKELK